MEVLVGAIDVEADPWIGNTVTTEVGLSVGYELFLEFFEEGFRKEVASGGSKHAVLVFDMPVIPYETIGSGLSRIGEFSFENLAKIAGDRGEVLLKQDGFRLHYGLDSRRDDFRHPFFGPV